MDPPLNAVLLVYFVLSVEAVVQPEWDRRGHAPPKQTCYDFHWCFISIHNC